MSTNAAEIEMTTYAATALDAYMEHHAEALRLAEEITEALATHDNAPVETEEDIHWGHVGDIAEIARQLRELADMMFQRGEHAPNR